MKTFGGAWTDEKLDRVAKYLKAYNLALKAKPSPARPFVRMYIDAFAGSGYRTPRSGEYPSLLKEAEPLAKGSARIALEVVPPFNHYIFIEANRSRFERLSALGDEFGDHAAKIDFIHGDANDSIARICRGTDWQRTRAVVFLDPFGMQVDWTTIEEIAATRAIDLWYLVPTGTGLSRLLPRNAKFGPGWEKRITAMTGDKNWRPVFYPPRPDQDLFGERIVKVRSASIESIEQYFLRRLRTCFAGVAPRGVRLGPKDKAPLYLLTFACANPHPKALALALKIAGYVIDNP
ncbi:MAG: three-Cys-motif partner protein TcmP [Alphaproteobacteria bacterium]